MAGELNLLVGRQLQDLLDALTNVGQSLTTLLGGATFASSDVAISAVGDALASGTGPNTNAVEGLANVDYDTHDLAVLLLLKSVANGGKHYMQPQLINVDVALFFELVGPFATMLVLGILPLRSHASFEEVVIGLEGEVGDR